MVIKGKLLDNGIINIAYIRYTQTLCEIIKILFFIWDTSIHEAKIHN